MIHDSATALHEDFIRRVRNRQFSPSQSATTFSTANISSAQFIEIFESQITSRLLDIYARKLRATGDCFYTIGSSGHEGNATVAAALKHTDPAFLHYRSAAFYIQRAKQVAGQTPVWDLLLSFTARADDPISGGRHKVLGSKALNIPPQTSTIASHLPKAVGAALSMSTAHRLEIEMNTPEDAVVVCNFGDASSNHSTSQGAFNLASWCTFQNLPLPLIFLCEDNGLGISVNTPKGWVENNFKHRNDLEYIQCDGLNIADTWIAAKKAEHTARVLRRPVFLHMKTIRLLGHAGADAEVAYRNKTEIVHNHDNDPLLHSARMCIENNLLTAEQVVDLYQSIEENIIATAEQVIQRPKIQTKAEVERAIIPTHNNNFQNNGKGHSTGNNNNLLKTVNESFPYTPLNNQQRVELFSKEKAAISKPQPLGKMINFALSEIMAEQKNVVVFGEDVGKKGGVYHVTARLQEKFGPARVFNTLLDETSILGTAIGLSQNNILPIPEIQFLAYVHNAEDQIRGEAATLSFFSDGQYTNPMVIRIAGLAYQKGFGGHFHNDNSFAVFRDIPGLIIACPSNGADAVPMLRECVRVAQQEGRVVIFLEPIALYMTRGLHDATDDLWCKTYPTEHKKMAIGEIGIFDQALSTNALESNNTQDSIDTKTSTDSLCIITYGNGYFLSRQATETLSKEHNIQARIIDLRWLAPLNEDSLLEACKGFKNVLIVDECRRTGSISEALFTLFIEREVRPEKLARITASDSFIPLADAASLVLPSKDDIVEKALSMCTGVSKSPSEQTAEPIQTAPMEKSI